ncbi:hypothetical protein [Hungatella hathewayi]
MEEFEDMLRSVLAERVQSIRKEFHKEQDRDFRTACVQRVDVILKGLPDEDSDWLYGHLTDEIQVAEEECTALYLAGVKDALRIMNWI